MATIPLVALDAKPPANPDVLENYGKLMAIQGQQQQNQQRQAMAPLQQQEVQQSVQTGAVDLQQKQQQLADQKAITAAMGEWDGKDYNNIYPLILKNGGSGTAVMGLKKSVLDQQQAIATTAKNNAQASQAQMAADKQRGDLLDGALTPLLDPKQTPDEQLPQALTQTVQQLTQSGVLDPQHAQTAAQLAQLAQTDPASARQQLMVIQKSNLAHSQIMEDALKGAQTDEASANATNARGKIDPTSPLYAPSPDAVALGTAPGAAQIQQNEVQQAGAKAGAEERARMPGEMALAAQRQALSQGDPNAAAKLLISGDATLSELKSRGATPQFIEQALTAAHNLSGGQYNAQSADAQFQVAKSPQNVGFFGSAKSLTDKGGTLDQLQQAAKQIPGGLFPAFNTIADWEKAATGSGPIAKYAALALGVADDYSKVMGGGQGSDTSRLQALKLVGANASPDQRSQSIEGIRGAVGSQMQSRIGSNPVLGRMYGSPQTSGVQQPNNSDPFAQFGGKAH